jgi:hypothetical protein
MPTLTLEIAQELLKENLASHDDQIYTDEFDAIDIDAAKELAQFSGFLSLPCLEQLSDSAAQALAKLQGSLSLNGLKQLGDSPGHIALAVKLATSYDDYHIRGLFLNGLTHLSDAAAEALAKRRCELYLNGLTQLSDAAAKALAKHQGGLSLHGLRQFSEAAAEMLSKHRSRVLRHREDGPAFTDARGNREWWFDENNYDTAGEWAEAVLKSRNEPHDDDSVEDFLRRVLCKEDLI